MAVVNGQAKGVADTLKGTKGDDTLNGLSGNDYLSGGSGNDVLIGGTGSDVLTGGLDADTFTFSAGHITDGAMDYITDFDLRQGDTLSFLDSGGGQGFKIVSVARSYSTVLEANGVDLRNNVDTGTDITFTVLNELTGAEQQIVLLDAWSGALSSQWDDYLASLGTSFNIA